MEFAGIALAVLGLGLAVALWVRSNKLQAAAAATQAELEERIAAEQTRASAAESDKAEALARLESLERDLAEAVARRDEKAMAAALFELELERSHRQWRDVIVPSDPARAGSINEGQKLTFAIAHEVDRLREEVGVAIRFDGALDMPLDAEVALGALRISEELLAMAAKNSDEVVVSIDQGDEPSLTVALTCAGWIGDAGSGDVEISLERMATRLDGFLRWRTEGEDTVEAKLQLPAEAPSV